MSQKNIEKLHFLLMDEDIKTVTQGLYLLESVVFSEEDIQAYFPHGVDYSNAYSLEEAIETWGWKHRDYVYVWILGLLARFEVRWVLEIELLDLRFKELQKLPDTLTNFVHLKELLLGWDLEKVPQEIFLLPNMTRLVLNGVNLQHTDIPNTCLRHVLYDATTSWPAGFDYKKSGAIGPEAILKGANLCGFNLNGADLCDADLREANLKGTDLRFADLCKTQLAGANLQDANLQSANLKNTNLQEVNLKGAHLEESFYDHETKWPEGFDYQNCGAIGPKAQLKGFDLRFVWGSDCNISEANLEEVNLVDTNLSGSNLKKTNLRRAQLNKTNLREANLKGADLREASLVETNLIGAILLDANLSGTNLQKAKYNDDTKWPEDFDYQSCGAYFIGPKTDLKHVDLRTSDLRNMNLCDADLSDANLCGSNLRYANLEGTNLTRTLYDRETKWPEGFDYQNSGAIGPEAKAHGTVLAYLEFDFADFHRADFSGADLRETSIGCANLSYANLSEANLEDAQCWCTSFYFTDLRKANLYKANLSYANFFGAHLNGADIRSAYLEGANLKGASLKEADFAMATYDYETKWPEGFDYQNCGAFGPNANLQGINLSGFNLHRLTGVNLSGSNLQDADLRRTCLNNINLQEVNLEGVHLEEAIYDHETKWPEGFDYQNSGAFGPKAKLNDMNLQGINLSYVNLDGADLRNTNLSKTALWGTNLSNANLNGARLTGARYDSDTKWPDDFNPQASGGIFKEQT